ncbi:MAG TPA: hypothetical protein ENK50_09055 [Sedimenticola sp.]|nr:hypothetical protein [Sedimenticola sp.]
MKHLLRGLLLLLALSLAWWWSQLPRTPGEFFRARCSTCHRLPDLCRYTPRQRAEIVVTMRTQHGADDVIDDEEARVITGYLEEGLDCPRK